MNKILTTLAVLAVVLVLPFSVGAAKAVAQDEAAGNKPAVAGDGIQNATQDEEYGEYGDGTDAVGTSPNEISGDGIPNAGQGEDYGAYGTDTAAPPAEATQYKGEDVPKTKAAEQVQTQNQGEAQQLQVTYTAATGSELVEAVEKVRADVRKEHDEENGARAEVRGDRENAEVALRAMVAAGPMLGEATQEMTQLATQYSGKSEQALAAEVKAQNKSGFARFFTGGDEEAAEELEQAAAQNRDTIRNMEQLVEDCEACDAAARETLREQIRAMEDEQDRIEQVATAEREKKGLFGFLFGWLG